MSYIDEYGDIRNENSSNQRRENITLHKNNRYTNYFIIAIVLIFIIFPLLGHFINLETGDNRYNSFLETYINNIYTGIFWPTAILLIVIIHHSSKGTKISPLLGTSFAIGLMIIISCIFILYQIRCN